MTFESTLPEGWALPLIEGFLELKYGKGLTKSGRVPGDVPVYGSNGQVGSHNEAVTAGQTIIVGRKGTVGAVHFSYDKCWPIDTTYFIDETNGCDIRYLYYGLQTLGMKGMDTSTAIPGLTRNDVYACRFPIAPLAEQKRIVAKVEALLERVGKARERFDRVPDLLKRFRQSVLAAACSGQLTADWREESLPDSSSALVAEIGSQRRERYEENNSTRYRSPLEPRFDCEYEFPEEWTVTSMDQLTCLVTSGSRGWAKYYSDDGPLFVRAQNIKTDELILDDAAHVTPPDSAEGRRTRVEKNDLLITITGANVAKSAIVREDIGEGYVSQHVSIARPVDPRVSEFLFLWVIGQAHGRAKLTDDAYGAGKPGLNLTNIRDMPVALPSLVEQQEIVGRVTDLLALADRIEQRLVVGAKRTEQIPQSILAKAFAGELVETEADLARREGRDYEPASVLLEQIASERAATANGKPKAGGKRKLIKK